MHQMRPRNTGVNRHGVVVPLDDDDELLQPVYQEPFQVRKNVLPPALDPKLAAAAAAASEVTTKRGLESAEAAKVSIEDVHSSMDNLKMVEPATLQLVRKGRTFFLFSVAAIGQNQGCQFLRQSFLEIYVRIW